MLEDLGGYDESLAYEDFDIWVRASQNYDFAYLDEVTTLYRKHQNSLSQRFYQKRQNILLKSTLKVLEKAYTYCKTEADFRALARNAHYHLRQCYFSENFELVEQYANFFEKQKFTWVQKLLYNNYSVSCRKESQSFLAVPNVLSFSLCVKFYFSLLSCLFFKPLLKRRRQRSIPVSGRLLLGLWHRKIFIILSSQDAQCMAWLFNILLAEK
jgi:hypothetical protein